MPPFSFLLTCDVAHAKLFLLTNHRESKNLMNYDERAKLVGKMLDFLNGGSNGEVFAPLPLGPAKGDAEVRQETQTNGNSKPRIVRPNSMREIIRRNRAMIDQIIANCRRETDSGPGYPDWDAVAKAVANVGFKRTDGTVFTKDQICAAYNVVVREG